MNEIIKTLFIQAGGGVEEENGNLWTYSEDLDPEKFALSVVKECIDKIETYRIPVGNSAAGEMACEWTYDALKEVRDEIKQHFGVKE